MKFNPKARLDRSQMRDRRGRGGSGGGRSGFPMPGGGGGGRLPIPAGGGIGGIILLIVILVVAAKCGGLSLPGGGTSPGTLPGGTEVDDSQVDGAGDLSHCQTGADAEKYQDCRILAVVNSVQDFWTDALPEQTGRDYSEADTVVFSGGTSTGCGQASSAMGPFYCPADALVYLDLTFFADMLEGQLGAKGGDFAEAYVIAHEYGHHVQDLLGTLARAQSRQTGPDSPGVKVELQADCYAGVWANHATTTADADGEVFISELTRDDIAEAVDAAHAVGDDYIQQRTQGRVTPEQWTHGSSESRMQWFQTGFEAGTLDACNTFQ